MMDTWEVMPYYVGVGVQGKSQQLKLNISRQCFKNFYKTVLMFLQVENNLSFFPQDLNYIIMQYLHEPFLRPVGNWFSTIEPLQNHTVIHNYNLSYEVD